MTARGRGRGGRETTRITRDEQLATMRLQRRDERRHSKNARRRASSRAASRPSLGASKFFVILLQTALFVLLAGAAVTRRVGSRLGLRRRRGGVALDHGLKSLRLMQVKVVVLGVQGDVLLREAVGHASLPTVPPLEARLANIVVGAVSTPVPVPEDRSRAAPVAGDRFDKKVAGKRCRHKINIVGNACRLSV